MRLEPGANERGAAPQKLDIPNNPILPDLLNESIPSSPYIPSATIMGAKIGPIPTSKALDKTPDRFRPADFKF